MIPKLLTVVNVDDSQRINDEAFADLTADFRDDQVIAIGARRATLSTGAVVPHYFAAGTMGEVRSWLPELWRYELEFAQATYWIMHPMNLALRRPLPTKENGYKAPWYPAKDEQVESFNCIPIDLDVGREGLPTAGDAIKIITNAVLEGRIPAPSYMALSGRGAYAIWRLRDPSGGLPENTQASLPRWRAILYKLINIAKELELSPDGVATNPARWLKLPGTLDTQIVDGQETKSGNRVIYLPFLLDSQRAPPVYTFEELESELGWVSPPPGLEIPKRPPPAALVIRRRREKTTKRNGSYVHTARAQEILSLSNSRGGLSEGCRYMALWYYFGSVRAQYGCLYPGEGVAVGMARKAAAELNASFCPPLSEAEVESACKNAKPRWKAATLAGALKVKKGEVEALGLRAIAPTEVRQHQDQAIRDGVLSRKVARLEQAELIRKLVIEHPGWNDANVADQVGGIDRQLVSYYRAQLVAEGRLPAPTRKKPSQLSLKIGSR